MIGINKYTTSDVSYSGLQWCANLHGQMLGVAWVKDTGKSKIKNTETRILVKTNRSVARKNRHETGQKTCLVLLGLLDAIPFLLLSRFLEQSLECGVSTATLTASTTCILDLALDAVLKGFRFQVTVENTMLMDKGHCPITGRWHLIISDYAPLSLSCPLVARTNTKLIPRAIS